MALVPYVVEQTGRGERSYDIYSRLLNDRIIMLCDQIDNATASVVIAQLLYLEDKTPKRILICISTAPEELSQPVWQYMIPCSISSATFRQFV